jgi:hypothetical protein
MRPGVVRNPRSHANRRGDRAPLAGVPWAEPATPAALAEDLKRFAEGGVNLVIVDGGDGTVREVLSAIPAVYGAAHPVIAVLASGKTNILALDLGAGRGWTLDAVLRRAREEPPRLMGRPPLEVVWADQAQPAVRGFILGVGAFARATQMSQQVNRMGAYHGLSVGLTLAAAAAGALFGGDRDGWRKGVPAIAALDDEPPLAGDRFALMATTLKRLPFGLKPFGPPHDGMKVLDVDAPPRGLAMALPLVLAGRGDRRLARRGYRRRDAQQLALDVAEGVVIDGERFPGGEIVVRRGAPVQFLAP